MAKVAVAIVGPLPPPSGGMANQTLQLARLLGEDGLTVEVVQVNPPYHPQWVGRLRGLRALFRLIPFLFALWRCAGRVQLFHVMANSGWAWHLFAAPAIWIARARGVPVIVNYRGGAAGQFMQRQGFLVRPSLRRAAAVLVPSAFLQKVFRQSGIEAEIVPNVVDLARFSPLPGGGNAVGSSRGPALLVSRNLEKIYDIGTALRAFAMVRAAHPDARLTIAGSGPLREELERTGASLGLAGSVEFTGRLDAERMAEEYRRASISLNPSLVDNMPNSLLEAMASGTPIVTTDVGGIPCMVEHEKTALLVPPGDPDAMAAAVLRLVGTPELAARLRVAGVESARLYSWASVRPRLFAVYAGALRARCPDRQVSP